MSRTTCALGLGLILASLAGGASAQMGFGRYEPKGFKPIAPAVTPAAPRVQPLPGYGPGNAPVYTAPKARSSVAPTPRPLAPIGAMDTGEAFKPYKPAKGYSTYEHDAPGRKKMSSTY